jgi:hypothetical protein
MKKLVTVSFCCIVGIFLLGCTKGKESDKGLEGGTAVKGDPGYTYKITIDKIQFNWMIENQNLKIKLATQNPGWIGIGFNPTNIMKDANFILGYVKNGAAMISNQHGISSTLHKKNEDIGGASHIMNPSGTEKNGMTEISFTIPLKTGNKLDRPIDVNGNTAVLLAYGESKNLAQLHAFRAKLNVNLSNGSYSLLLMTGK